MARAKKTATASASGSRSRRRLSQADVPAYTLQEAIRVAEVLRDEYAKQPTKPLDVAKVLDMGPSGTSFKMLTGAAVAYGLITGGAQADEIALEEIGRRIVAPTEEGDDLRAMREALLRPRVIREFLQKYNGSPLPSEQVARNVLEQMGVPSEATERARTMILTNAEALGLLVEIKGKRYVRLDAAPAPRARAVAAEEAEAEGETYEPDEAPPVKPPVDVLPKDTSRVFITHGSNKAIVEQIKEILGFGNFEPHRLRGERNYREASAG